MGYQDQSGVKTPDLSLLRQQILAIAPDYGLAQSILGMDFITPEEVSKGRSSIVYTADQIIALAESLPPLDVLKWCKDNDYVVIPAPPTQMSTINLYETKSDHFRSYTKMGVWYDNEKFAHEDKTSFGWLAIKKTPVLDSTNKNWNDQIKLLSNVEYIPNAAEMSWFITTYFEVHGVRLLDDVYVRTSSLDSDGYHFYVGCFSVDGLIVNNFWGDCYSRLGLSVARKLPKSLGDDLSLNECP